MESSTDLKPCDILIKALRKIGAGTEDDFPPYRAISKSQMQIIAQKALVEHEKILEQTERKEDG